MHEKTQRTDADDLSLVRLALSGDADAFVLLYQKNEQRLKCLIHKLVKDTNLAEDVLQETLLKAYKSLAQFRGEAQFATWLYSIAFNTAHKMLADIRCEWQNLLPINKYATFDNSDQVGNLAISQDSPEQILQAKQSSELLEYAINLLPVCLKEAWLLREINDMSYAEIAQKMRCSIGTVRSRIFRARESIAKKIKLYQ